MDDVLYLLVGLSLGLSASLFARFLRLSPGSSAGVRSGESVAAADGTSPGVGGGKSQAGPAGDGPAGSEAAGESPDDDGVAAVRGAPEIYRCVAELEPFFERTAHPGDLEQHPAFVRGVRILAEETESLDTVLYYTDGGPQILACLALAALEKREDATPERALSGVLHSVDVSSNWARFFGLRYLDRRVEAPIVPQVLRQLDTSWGTPQARGFLKDFVRTRRDRGEIPAFEGLASTDDDDVTFAAGVLKEIDTALGTSLAEALPPGSAEPKSADRQFLESFGRFPVHERVGLVRNASAERVLATVTRSLEATRPRSVLVVGDPGTGKTACLRLAFADLAERGWTVFEASAAQVISGQSYIGELEERLRLLVTAARTAKRFVWSVPALHELAQLGRHRQSNVSILDQLVGPIEAGEILVVGEVSTSAYERMLALRPGLDRLFETVRLEPPPPAARLEFVREWALANDPGRRLEDDTLREACALADQFLAGRGVPGGVVDLLTRALEARSGEDSAPTGEAPAARVDVPQLLETLARITGLASGLIDDREKLDVSKTRAFFESRVLGQTEAVECLVDRIAMIKAGLTDPSRPSGVFLFTGPTGTGKTEIAKALSEFLFGSADRMIRLDMSELQTWEAFARVLGDSSLDTGSKALVHRIREQPFSVILLDEFEKAHPRVWDLFLQVFDDGRLGDGQGNVADCRHTIFVLTTNVAGEAPESTSIGFKAATGDTDPQLDRALSEVFRRELLNRIDRIVRFRPLGRSIVRGILLKELAAVLERRGLRSRQWAVEWEESALELLMSRGFSERYGARPLKRSIERYLLSPLAKTIVSHSFPEGDQFLFVRSDGESLQVEFVDPDAPEGGELAPVVETGEITARSIVLAPRGSPRELAYLEQAHATLDDRVHAPTWESVRREALDAMARPGFWTSEERWSLLDDFECRDRIVSALAAARSLLDRLGGDESHARARFPPRLFARLAEELYLVDEAVESVEAGTSQDAVIAVLAVHEPFVPSTNADDFARRLAGMYRAWARRRRVKIEVLEEGGAADAPYRFVASLAGLGAYRILAREAGHHALEWQDGGRVTTRVRARVVVEPDPDLPRLRNGGERRVRASRALEAGLANEGAEIVRRYREEPSPLVRDLVRGWRTGKLSQVLGGDFDLFDES